MSTPTITISTPSGIIHAATVVLGFVPTDSTVMLNFGEGNFHARVDMSVDEASANEVAGVLADAVIRNGPRQGILAFFTDDHAAAWRQLVALNDRLPADFIVFEAIRVHDGHYFTLPDGASHPIEDEVLAVMAERVAEGHVFFASRDELAASIAANPPGEDTAAVAQVVAEPATESTGSVARWLWNLSPDQTLDAGDCGALARAMIADDLRDVVVARINRETALSWTRLLSDVIRRVPTAAVPVVGSVLGFAAWQQGNGALAWCAVDRALKVDPNHTMSVLVAEALTQAVNPDTWAGVDPADLTALSAE